MSEERYRDLAAERFARRPSWSLEKPLRPGPPRDAHEVEVQRDDDLTIARRRRDVTESQNRPYLVDSVHSVSSVVSTDSEGEVCDPASHPRKIQPPHSNIDGKAC